MPEEATNVLNFTATARIPCRPLSTEHEDLAEPKELLVDYNLGNIKLSKADGTIVDLTTTIKEVIMKNMKEDNTLPDNITIIIDGNEYTLQTVIEQNVAELDELKTALGYKKDSDGSISFSIFDTLKDLVKQNSDGTTTLEIPASSITETEDKKIMTKEERDKLAGLVKPRTVNITVSTTWSGSAVPYTQQINVTGIKATDVPIVDIILSDTYSTAMTQLDNYAYIYRMTTHDGYVIVYATQKTTTALTLQMKLDT